MVGYNKIIKHYGAENQLNKAIEELGELSVELMRYKLGNGNKEALTGEIADVLNMINQVVSIYEIDFDQVTKIMGEKTERQIKRIESELNGK